MSSFQAIAIMVVIGIANLAGYFVLQRWMYRRSDIIVGGMFGGIPVSMQHRWFILHHSWVNAIAAQVGFQAMQAILFIVIGGTVDAGPVQLLAYLNASVLLLAGVLGTAGQGWASYNRLKSILREAGSN